MRSVWVAIAVMVASVIFAVGMAVGWDQGRDTPPVLLEGTSIEKPVYVGCVDGVRFWTNSMGSLYGQPGGTGCP